MEQKQLGIEIVATANALRRTTFQIGCDGRASQDSPTSMQQWFLAYIGKNFSTRDIFQKDLEDAFQLRRSTATEILKAMERKGLIIRLSLPEDRRKKKILPTDKAWALYKENQEKIMRTEQAIVQGLTKDEISTVFRVLEQIQQNLTD